MSELTTGPWTLESLKRGTVKPNGMTVFSCFHCGGGSTMGYKLAGFDVIGGVEIDPEMMAIYRKNHNPKFSYLMGVQEFKTRHGLPSELFNLEILDGSPPCSSFSMAGSREEAWGENKKFREGQAHQVLDDLFFHFIDIGRLLKPKVIVAENVKGLIMGNARGYVKEIFRAFDDAGYAAQLFLLNASRMGVPQARERTVFIARRRDLDLPEIKLEFNEPTISVERAIKGCAESVGKPLSPAFSEIWPRVERGKLFSTRHRKKHMFNWRKLDPRKPASTVTATHCMTHWSEPRLMSPTEVMRLQTFPDDFDFCGQDAPYVCGMSVPPIMMQRIAVQIQDQLLKPLQTRR